MKVRDYFTALPVRGGDIAIVDANEDGTLNKGLDIEIPMMENPETYIGPITVVE